MERSFTRMKSYKHYIKKETKGQIIFIIFLLIAIAAGLIWNAIELDRNTLKPDAVYPMANASISWEQTFASGSWNE